MQSVKETHDSNFKHTLSKINFKVPGEPNISYHITMVCLSFIGCQHQGLHFFFFFFFLPFCPGSVEIREIRITLTNFRIITIMG